MLSLEGTSSKEGLVPALSVFSCRKLFKPRLSSQIAFFQDGISMYIPAWLGTCYMDRASLELTGICLSWPFQCWDSRSAPPYLSSTGVFNKVQWDNILHFGKKKPISIRKVKTNSHLILKHTFKHRIKQTRGNILLTCSPFQSYRTQLY